VAGQAAIRPFLSGRAIRRDGDRTRAPAPSPAPSPAPLPTKPCRHEGGGM